MAQSSTSFLQEPSTRIEHPDLYLISNYLSGALVKFHPQEPAEGLSRPGTVYLVHPQTLGSLRALVG